MEENKKENKELEKLHKELQDCKVKCDEYLNGWKRERADFLNHKKEEIERIGTVIKYANEEIILKILPILDNVYLAESHAPEELKNNKWINGFLQIKKQLSDFLAKEGIEHIEVIGKPFDPNTMEAVEEIENSGERVSAESSGESASAVEAGTVVEEIQRGYTLHGKLIRPAKVKISK